MAERWRRRRHAISLEYRFDRLLVEKLAQAYDLLVPDKHWPVGRSEERREVLNAQDGGDLRTGFVGPAEGGSHDCQSDGCSDSLIQYAEEKDYAVPPEWIFQDEGYSGAILVRPGLEALRDLAAQGHIEAVLVHFPDRLSRSMPTRFS